MISNRSIENFRTNQNEERLFIRIFNFQKRNPLHKNLSLSLSNSFLLHHNRSLTKRNSSIKGNIFNNSNKSPINLVKVPPKNIFERLFYENVIIKE